MPRPGWAPDPLMGWWDSSSAPTLAFWVRFPSGGPRAKRTWVLRHQFISLPPRGVLQRLEEQSWSGCGESGGIEGQSQYHRLHHRSSPSSPVTVFARFTHRLPPLSQFAHAARTLVRGGPTRPHRPRLVQSHSTRARLGISMMMMLFIGTHSVTTTLNVHSRSRSFVIAIDLRGLAPSMRLFRRPNTNSMKK